MALDIRLIPGREKLIREGAAEIVPLTGSNAVGRGQEADSAVVARARRGDRAAFDQLYVRHRDHVYTLCLNLCGNREQAEDLLQETFVRAYRALAKFRGGSRLSTWLHRIAVNLCHEAARRRRRAPVPPQVSANADPAAVDQVRVALARLRPPHRLVLVLRYMQSLSYKEISELLNWSLTRVKVTLHRAKRAFKEVYSELDECEP